jgi:hypothetical protein
MAVKKTLSVFGPIFNFIRPRTSFCSNWVLILNAQLDTLPGALTVNSVTVTKRRKGNGGSGCPHLRLDEFVNRCFDPRNDEPALAQPSRVAATLHSINRGSHQSDACGSLPVFLGRTKSSPRLALRNVQAVTAVGTLTPKGRLLRRRRASILFGKHRTPTGPCY